MLSKASLWKMGDEESKDVEDEGSLPYSHLSSSLLSMAMFKLTLLQNASVGLSSVAGMVAVLCVAIVSRGWLENRVVVSPVSTETSSTFEQRTKSCSREF
jgi:hypothetical protein